ncbi:MAG: ATP-binding protein [Cyanobacteria bacterium P01_A01_bin.84]
MKVSLNQKKSLYQLALCIENPPSVSSLSAVTLLSLLKSQIDFLIEQEIRATLWVKLPPGKIWFSQVQRYHSWSGGSQVIYYLNADKKNITLEENNSDRLAGTKDVNIALERFNSLSDSPQYSGNFDRFNFQYQQVRKLKREYFVAILSPQWCSLILAYRPLQKKRPRNTKVIRPKKIPKLVGITTFESRVIKQVLEGIEQFTVESDIPLKKIDDNLPVTPDPVLMGKLFAKQLQQQNKINLQTAKKRAIKVQQQAQKLENHLQLKDEYLSNVCQELSTPLTHMKTALSLLNSPSLKNPQRQRYLQMLSNQCDRQNSVISGVLELVQIERNIEDTPLEAVKLADIVPGVVSTYQPITQEKGIMLAYTVPMELPAVWCISGGLKQIVIHLLSNSINFTPNGGQVWVRGRLHGEYIQLEFRDTGIGIADHEIPKIFERFYRVRPSTTEDPGGAGLGLTIVQKLLQHSGGSISVKSKLSEGSTFTISLPIASEEK